MLIRRAGRAGRGSPINAGVGTLFCDVGRAAAGLARQSPGDRERLIFLAAEIC